MATRNLTGLFENIRSTIRRPGDLDVANAENSYNPNDALHVPLPPKWVDITDIIQNDIESVKSYLIKLSKLYQERLKVTFDIDEAKKDKAEINKVVKIITKLLKKCENSVKTIASIDIYNITQQEKTIRLNVMRGIGVELQTLSKRFRTAQKDYMDKLRSQQAINNEFFNDKSNLNNALDRGLNQNEVQQLEEELDKTVNEREKEIIRIAQSINELSTVFKELSVLVIEQGSVLDRIDYNIENTLVKVQSGVKELKIADEYSKKS